MLHALALSALVAGGAVLPPAPTAVTTVPDEPAAFTLPEAPTYQAVVADVDADGFAELVRLVRGERGSIVAEVWDEEGGAWTLRGAPLTVVPPRPTGGQGNVVYAGAPAQLMVRRVPGGERVTLVRRPRFEEPALEVDCCLLVHDIVVTDGGPPTLGDVADRDITADAVLVLDLDGDGVDELLVTRSLPPLGDIAYPTDARVYRWTGARFAVTATELPIGSGDAPYALGDSDGEPGEEAALISTLGRPGLFRIALGPDGLVVDEADGVPVDAVAVPLGDGQRGVAVLDRAAGVTVHRWQRGAPIGEAVGHYAARDGTFAGVIGSDASARLLFREAGQATLNALPLPGLDRLGSRSISPSPAAANVAGSPLRPYSGPLPGFEVGGGAGYVHHGRPLLGATLADPIASMPGVVPLGAAGVGDRWIALFHAPLGLPPVDPRGGRLDAPVLDPAGAVSLAPREAVLAPEHDDGIYRPALPGAVEAGDVLVIGPSGATAQVIAPPGSRVALAVGDPTAIRDLRAVPDSGWLPVPIVIQPPSFGTPNPRYLVVLAVTTPAGHGYVARWDVRVTTEPPRLAATATTRLGSADVAISGETDPHATVSVAGRPVRLDAEGRFHVAQPLPPWPTDVEVIAVDPLGNETRTSVTGIGWLDYRGLPWVPISVVVVALAGAVLFLRVPRLRTAPRSAGREEGTLEELEPD